LESLKTWVKKLSEVEFTVDDKRKLELIIGLINKFIFVQTLDDYGVIEFNWIRKRWNYHEQMWQRKGKLMVIEKFFDELDNWFYLYYDTELFKEKILPYVKRDNENISRLYNNLQLVLGLTYLQLPFGALKGIMQYNFRYIDEDVFGKAYETFLAGVRHDEGVYYTPKYITQYIAENTVARVFDGLLEQIKAKLESEDFEEAKKLVSRFASVSVLDPACGSGSFLIKAIRLILARYSMLNQLIDDSERMLIKKNAGYMGSLDPPREVKVKFEQIAEIRKIAGPKTGRELISKVLVRHIHGNDLDKMALEVAKVNIWLEAIKLAPKEFRFDKLPAETNYILPILRINLCNGDSVFGLPEDMTVDLLVRSYRTDVVKLCELWQGYLDNPMQPELVDQIEEIKEKLRRELDSEFRKILEAKQLSQVLSESKPFHWALEFWHLYFDSTGNPLPKSERGADVVLGNPPYERIQVLKKKSPTYVKYLDNAGFSAATRNYDLAVIFIEKGFKLLKEMGEFGYIVTNKFMQADYGEGIRDYLSKGKFVRELIDFGDQQVFDDATTYTVLVFLSSRPTESFKYALVRKLERTLGQLMKVKHHEKLDEPSLTVLTQKEDTLSEKPWIFARSEEEKVLDKLRGFDRLSKIAKVFVGLQTSADPVYVVRLIEDKGALVKVYSKARDKEYVLEKELLKPMLMGRDIKRWWIDKFQSMVLFPYEIKDGKAILLDQETLEQKYPRIWQYLQNNKEDLGKRERGTFIERPDWYGYVYLKNMDKFDLPKIMTQVLANRSAFAIDHEGKYYFPGGGNAGGYGVILKEQNLSLKFLCALLNSSLLDWNLKKISTRFRGGFYSYARRFLERLPIKIPETKVEYMLAEKCEQSVNRILQLMKARYVLLDQWIAWATKLKNDEQSLEAILAQDMKNLREGATQKLWTSKVSFYPPECTETLNKTYNDFRIIGSYSQPSIKIFGIDEDNNEEQIYELEFEDRDLMLHFYHSLMQTLESRAKVKTLSQLFAKTMIPIVKEVNRSPKEMTPNIMKKVKEDFEKWKSENHITDVKPDIVNIINEVDNAEAEIDALVFKLYGLQENEINTIFDSLKTSPIYQAKVIQILRKL
jgi:type I restriction-modification system DNA methylase subunit